MLFIASFVASLRLCFVLSLGFLAMLFVAGSLFLVLSGFLPVRFCGMLVCFVVLLVEAFGVHECDRNDEKYILDEQTLLTSAPLLPIFFALMIFQKYLIYFVIKLAL